MEKMKKLFNEMLESGLESQIRETAKEGKIINWDNATIVPVMGFIPDITKKVFIAGAYLLGQNEDGEAQLLCIEPHEDNLPNGVMEWAQNMMLMEGIVDEESICELLLDFQMAVVATDFEFQNAEETGWNQIFEDILQRKRSTNRRALSKIAEMGQIRDALKEMLSMFLGDLAEGIDNWAENLGMGKSIYVSMNDPIDESNGFSEEFNGEWS